MFFVLTTYGQSVQATLGSYAKLYFKLGSAFGYTPASTQTVLQGTVVKAGTTSAPYAETASLLKFSIVLDHSEGPYDFGEVGLYDATNTAVAFGVNGTILHKIPQTYYTNPNDIPNPEGNQITIDCLLPLDGNNGYGYITNSDSNINVGKYSSVDALPQCSTSNPNIWLVPNPISGDFNTISTVGPSQLWSISGYESITAEGSVTTAVSSGSSVFSYSLTSGSTPVITIPGIHLIQFISGPSRGFVRTLTTISPNVMGLRVPLLTTANIGDRFVVMSSMNFSAFVVSLLNGLDSNLSSAILNSLTTNPPNKMLRIDGNNMMLAPLNFGGNRGVNVADPVEDQDATNKKWVSDFLSGAQGGFGNVLDQLENLKNNVFYKDGSISATGNFDLDSFQIKNVSDATANHDAVNLQQVTCLLSNYGNISPGLNIEITGSGSPTEPYVISTPGTKVTQGSGVTVTGDGSPSTPYVITFNSASFSFFPSGGIIMWSGILATIPSGWALCDGSSGTPDLRNRFVVGAGNSYPIGATGGNKDAVVVSHSHNVSIGDHSHSYTDWYYPENNATTAGQHFVNVGTTIGSGDTDWDNNTVLYRDATTSVASTSGITDSQGQFGTNANLPPYYALAFIMKL